MSPEFKTKIFDSFSREQTDRVNKIEGTGLGMSITKYIIDAMQGEVQVESEPGHGSAFHVTLDLEKATVSETDMVLPNWNMLVVDDDREIVKAIGLLLEKEGYQVLKAYDGMEALKLVAEHPVRLIIMDVMMPKLNGLSALMKIRENNQIPVIILSAKTQESDKVSGLVMGADDYVEKPVDMDILCAKVKALMHRNYNLKKEKHHYSFWCIIH